MSVADVSLDFVILMKTTTTKTATGVCKTQGSNSDNRRDISHGQNLWKLYKGNTVLQSEHIVS